MLGTQELHLSLLLVRLDGSCYWGYAFEDVAIENYGEIDVDGKGIDANVEFVL